MQVVLVSTFGSWGDVNPFIALGRGLLKNNIRPVFLVSPNVTWRFKKDGLDVVEVGPEFDIASLLRESPELMSFTGAYSIMKDLFLPFIPELYKKTEQAIIKYSPKAIIYHPLCFGSAMAAEKFSLPKICVHLAPMSLCGKADFSIYPLYKRATMRLMLPLACVGLSIWMRWYIKELPVKWSLNIFTRLVTEPDMLIGLWPKWFGKCDDSVRYCGFPFNYQDSYNRDPMLEEFLEQGEPPIALAFGSTAVHLADGIHQYFREICSELGCRCLIFTGKQGEFRVDGDTCFIGSASYTNYLKKFKAVVIHGGIGTSAAALKSGVPIVVVPHAHDQFDNAERIKRLGKGEFVWNLRLNKERLKLAVAKVVGEPGYSRSDYAEVLTDASDGGEVAAGYIREKIAGN